MRETLRTKDHQQVNLLTLNGTVVDDLQYKEGLRTIHTTSVAAVINAQQKNKVLQQPSPNISKTEASLNRKTRVTLAQLRSGYSPYLNSYLNRINPTTYPTDSCPDCEQSPHTTDHLFTCPANTTTLSTKEPSGRTPQRRPTLRLCRTTTFDRGYNNNNPYNSTRPKTQESFGFIYSAIFCGNFGGGVHKSDNTEIPFRLMHYFDGFSTKIVFLLSTKTIYGKDQAKISEM